ncbi:ribosomal oxygenase 1-like isoform X2 [Lytechinus variegatus]|uniref:ribosomal oxygenase 1-like isoform X2 n=1 Tax=Lytechinus variegatus TaxID=7654 RepID=UPI001BB15B23|nr:ribosomal oxygenase 1-like isoform X2 [Lytechinus variegatus]
MDDGKRISAYAAFKAKQNATPKTEHHGKVEKPETSTPFVGLIKQGRGKLKKIRESARSKKTKKAVKRSEGMARRLQTEDMDIDDKPGSSKSSSRTQPTKTEDPKPRESSRKKRKSPYTTTPEMGRRKNITPPLQPTEPTAKRLKFNDNGKDSTIAGSSSSVPDNPLKRDSLQHGKDVFAWLISPFKVEDYFKNIFERKPLFLKRHNKNYFTDIFSSEELSDILKENDLQFTRNIDVTTYTNGKRETHNPTGRAQPQVVWDYYRNGCSVRILNPQTYSTRVCQLLAALQEFFGCFVGANIYLTPPGSQGFAPHYDDIEAFVLQLEGKKHWKLYNQRSPSEVLPRFSSSNFTDADIGEPILNTTLEAGDLLYFPRGVIHQASTPSETHSLHITISACQKNTWGDLMEHVLTRALHVVREENIEFRKSLPTDYLNYMGVAHQDLDDDRRQPFMKKIGDLFSKLLKSSPVDAAVDQMSLEFFHTSLPPVLEEAEESCCVFGENASCKNGQVSGLVELSEDTQIRLLRRNILRLVPEDDKVLVYHSVENSRVYKEKELQFIEIPPEFAPAVEHLIHSYPDYIPVSTLGDQLEDTNGENADPVDLAQTLYENGLLMTRSKLEPSMSLPSDRHKDVTICQTR